MFESERGRLRRMLALRMDARLRGRVDQSDILQDAWGEVARRIGGWLEDPRMPFGVWVRFLAMQRLMQLHRRHVGAQKRSVEQEVRIAGRATPHASSVVMAEQLVGHGTTPGTAIARLEARGRIIEALENMEPLDKEIIVLRRFEEFSNAETAQMLDISENAASNRYVRAMKRLGDVLREVPDVGF